MKFGFAVLFLAGWCSAQTPAHTNHFPNTSNATVLYGAISSVPSSYWPSVNTWLGQHFDWVIGGGGPIFSATGPQQGDVHGGASPKLYWTAYTDMFATGIAGMYNIQSVVSAEGLNYEDAILHSSVDMQWGVSGFGAIPLHNINTFDCWEAAAPNGSLVQGILTSNGGTFTDNTTALSTGVPTIVSDTLYVGLQVPFDQLNISLSAARAGGSVAYQYWNGSAWASLSSHFNDATSGLSVSGKVSFYPPSDWTPNSLTVNITVPMAVTNTHSKYWVRVIVSGAFTPPVLTSVLNEDWTIASGSNNARGWDPAAPNRINVGTPVEYNPAPPANATAKFKYQSRVPCASNDIVFNPSKRASAVALKGYIDLQIYPPNNFDGAFLDDGGRTPFIPTACATPQNCITGSPIYLAYFDYAYDSSNSDGWDGWWTAQGTMVSQVASLLKAEHGSNFWITTNSIVPASTTQQNSPIGDAIMIESFSTPIGAGGCTYNPSGSCPYYDYAAATGTTNTNGARFYMQAIDRWSYQGPWTPAYHPQFTYWHPQDNAQRTPMSTLIQNYIGSNAKTGFMYYGGSGNINGYFEVDQVYVYDTDTTLTSNISPSSPGNHSTFTIAANTNCTGAYIGLGPKQNGDTVIGALGRVFINGLDSTLALRQLEVNPMGMVSWPNTIYAGDAQKFGSLKVVLSGTSVPGTGTWQYWNGTAWMSLPVMDGTSAFSVSGTITFSPPSDWVPTSYGGFTNYWIRTINLYTQFSLKLLYSPDWVTVNTTDAIFNSYASGSPAHCIEQKHLSVDPVPAVSSVYAWSRWFPAMDVDIGSPNLNGLNGGARIIPWKTGGPPDNVSGQSSCSPASKCPDVWRRDFTKSIVLYRPWIAGVHLEAELDVYSHAIPLGGTYYPLSADGSTGPAVTSIVLRAGEGAILMLAPISFSGPAKLGFVSQPAGGVAGTALSPTPVVQLQDGSGNVYSAISASITLSSSPQVISTTATTSNGTATFGNMAINTAGTYTLAASSNNLTTVTSNAFVISAANAANLSFGKQPGTALVGMALSGITVEIRDVYGNLTKASNPVSLISSPPGINATVAAVNGIATFNGLILGASGSYTLTATSGGLTPAVTTLAVAAATGTNFVVSGHVTLNGVGLSGITINVNGSQSTSTTTDNSGNYTVILAKDGSYILAPAAAGYSFSGAVNLSNLAGNQVINFSASATAGLEFYPITPCRVADTRSAAGFAGTVGPPIMDAGTTRSFPVLSSACGVPPTAAAYSLNITVVPKGYLGYLSIWPTGQPLPMVSTLNSYQGTIVANAAVVPAGNNGEISVHVSEATEVLLDINGYFAPPSSGWQFYPVAPCRVADTRTGGGKSGLFGPPQMIAGGQRSFPIPSSECGIPPTATAYSVNFTVLPELKLGLLTTWPTGQAQPNASTLNSYTGTVVSNQALIPAGAGGAVSVYVSDTSNLIMDISGYFAPPIGSGLHYYPVTPCRVIDTRAGTGIGGLLGPPSMAAGAPRSFPVPSSSCGVPSSAAAYALNVTAIPRVGYLGYLIVWPTGQAMPNTSTLNSYSGTVVANAAIVPAGSGGSISVYVSDPVDLAVDINGFFAP